MNIVNLLTSQRQTITQKISDYESELQKMPKGRLICSKNGTRYKWYVNKDGKTTYLKKARRKNAEALAYKEFLTCSLADMQYECEASDAYLRKMSKRPNKTGKFHDPTSEYSRLLSSKKLTTSDEIIFWQKMPYESNPKNPEGKIFKSISGTCLRSKSEVIIDTMLTMYGIPHRYEAALDINGIRYYPDFTIRHPVTGKIFYWEHFGMMNSADYSESVWSKLKQYNFNDIIVSHNLICTFEGTDKPLNEEYVRMLIEHYFLQ